MGLGFAGHGGGGHSPGWGTPGDAAARSRRETVGTYDCVNVLLPQDAAQLFQAEGVFPRRMGIEAWSAHRRLRNHKCGVFLL